MRAYLSEVLRMIDSSAPFEVLAHIGLARGWVQALEALAAEEPDPTVRSDREVVADLIRLPLIQGDGKRIINPTHPPVSRWRDVDVSEVQAEPRRAGHTDA